MGAGEGADAPIRIAQFTRAFYLGGTEGQVLELLRGLSPEFDVHVGVLEAAGPLIERVWALGYVPEEFPLKGSVAQANTAVQIGRLALWLRQRRIELVHVHDFYSTLLAVPAARLARAKVVVGRLDLAHWHGSARRAVLRELTRASDHVIANADAVRRMLVEEEVLRADRITVIRNGIDLEAFDQRAGEPLEAPLPDTHGAKVALLVANMNHPVKRQEDFLHALATLRRRGREVQGWLLGDGERRAHLEALAAQLKLGGVARFLSFRTDIPAVWRRADVGVLCSSAEGLSNAIIEGMASRVPMVVTDVGGNPELVQHGERGLVVQPNRPDELAFALERLLGDDTSAQRMGEAGRVYVAEALSFQRLVDEHAQLYRRVARRRVTSELVAAPAIAMQAR